ncbi:hypothetical protein TNCV_4000411 [Trichonephila clavipes]|nr:hypothetical protein TNCV_4000411 [Trichonephila clavipes]
MADDSESYTSMNGCVAAISARYPSSYQHVRDFSSQETHDRQKPTTIVESELNGISNALATSTFLSPSLTDSITFFFSEIVKHLYFLKEDMSFLSRDKLTLR